MAKGGREVKKPKKEVPKKSPAAAPSTKGNVVSSAVAKAGGKKK